MAGQELTWNGKYPLINNTIFWRKLLVNYAILGVAADILLGVAFLAAMKNILAENALMAPVILLMPLFAIIPILLLFIVYHLLSMLYISTVRHGTEALYVINASGVGCAIKDYRLFGQETYDPEYNYTPGDPGDNVKFFYGYMSPDNYDQYRRSSFQRILWHKVRSVRIYEDKPAIEIRGGLLRMPVILFCTSENLEDAIRLIRDHTDHSVCRLLYK